MPFKANDEVAVNQFCNDYASEVNGLSDNLSSFDTKTLFLRIFYHANALLNIVGYRTFSGSDSITRCIFVRILGSRS